MIQFDFNEDCCGCTACANTCSVKAITMVSNKEGFIIPQIDTSKCNLCNRCNKVCPHLNNKNNPSSFSLKHFSQRKAFIYYSPTPDRINSASGGFCYALGIQFLKEGGWVCGSIWNERMEAVHVVSNQLEIVRRMQSSKYVQSNLTNCFTQIKELLINKQQVLFCGTPCQTAGLKQFLPTSLREQITLIALICHGVPSPLVWEKYKEILQKRYSGKLFYVNMRDKTKKGYSCTYCKYTFQRVDKNGTTKYHTVASPTYLSDPYVFLFTDNLFLRNSCYHCKYKADKNGADIIVGDFHPSTAGDDYQGCNTLLAMNQKGEQIIKQTAGIHKEVEITKVGNINSMLWESVKKNPQRSDFFDKMNQDNLAEITLFTDYLPFRFKIKKQLNSLGLFSLIKKIIP